MNKFKRHLSVANVLSCLALFVALGGSAYAATKLGVGQVKTVNIAPQAVTNPKIKTQAVTSGKIKNLGINSADLGTGSVINSKLANGAVSSAKLGKKSVTTAALAKEAVTTEKIGKEAIDASKISTPLWAQLVRNVAYFSATSVEDSEEAKFATVECPKGKEAIGGGARLNGELKDVSLTGTQPLAAGNSRTGWQAFGHETGTGTTNNWSITAFVVCAEL